MSGQTIDYAALAKQAGAISSTPPSGIDYAALAKQAGAISSTPASTELTPDQLNRLRTANANRSPWRKILGLAPTDTQGAQLDQQAMESQKNAMASSPTVRQQVGTAALGTGILAAGAATPAAVDYALPAAGTASKWILNHPIAAGLGYHLARELGVPLPKILDVLSKFGGSE